MYNNSSKPNDTMSGVLVVDKPVGMTSHEVVQIIRRGTNTVSYTHLTLPTILRV